MNVSVAQWIGRRAKQEDAYAVRHYPSATLAVVCDGMGGHDCGYQAADTASKAFISAFDTCDEANVAQRLQSSLNRANAAVGDLFRHRGMFGGCTLLAVYASGGVVWWVSVGDSPLLLWRRNRLLRLNQDHSMRAIYKEFVKSGTMSYEDAMAQGHCLRSAVTGEPIPLVDAPLTPYPLLPGDRIILASDGIDELMLPSPMAQSVQDVLNARGSNLSADLVEACRAMNRPEADNVTVLSMDC